MAVPEVPAHLEFPVVMRRSASEEVASERAGG
jgi:hypothetical protein